MISVAALLAAIATCPQAAGAQARAIGDTRVFAMVPEPGQPAGIAVDGQRVLVSTAGVFQPSMDPRLFVYDLAARRLAASHDIPLNHAEMGMVGQHPVMTFFGVAADAAGRAYVVDMNGRVIRVDPLTGKHDDYATFPGSVGGLSTMPFDIAFDHAGSAYVTDQNTATIWRIPPGGGAPQMWFQDARLAGYLFGASGIRLDPTGRYLYFSVAESDYPATTGAGLVYRVPLVDHPTAAQLQEVYRYPSQSLPFGIAFGASGKLYVALAGPNQVSILQPGGGATLQEAKRFPSAEENRRQAVPYDSPMSIAFDGCGSLLVTNSTALSPPMNPAHWAIFDAYVGDTAAPLERPALPGAPPVSVRPPTCLPAPTPTPLLHQTLRCLAGQLPLGPAGLGAVRLGDTRRRMLRRVGVGPVRTTRNAVSWCIERSSGTVTAVFGRDGRALLVASTASGSGLRGLRPGMSSRALARAYPRRRAVAPGLWRLSPRSNRIVRLGGGRVLLVGVADAKLLGRPRQLARRLHSGGL